MAIDYTVSLVDGYSRSSSKRWEGLATVLATAVTNASGLLADFLGVSDMGTVVDIFSSQVANENAATAGANVDAGGTLHLRLDNGKAYALKIPAIKPSLINIDGSINIAAAAITDFVANFESAGQYRVSEGNYVTKILYGELDR
jgi:hypothetical protein